MTKGALTYLIIVLIAVLACSAAIGAFVALHYDDVNKLVQSAIYYQNDLDVVANNETNKGYNNGLNQAYREAVTFILAPLIVGKPIYVNTLATEEMILKLVGTRLHYYNDYADFHWYINVLENQAYTTSGPSVFISIINYDLDPYVIYTNKSGIQYHGYTYATHNVGWHNLKSDGLVTTITTLCDKETYGNVYLDIRLGDGCAKEDFDAVFSSTPFSAYEQQPETRPSNIKVDFGGLNLFFIENGYFDNLTPDYDEYSYSPGITLTKNIPNFITSLPDEQVYLNVVLEYYGNRYEITTNVLRYGGFLYIDDQLELRVGYGSKFKLTINNYNGALDLRIVSMSLKYKK